jgi:hypothetical protein
LVKHRTIVDGTTTGIVASSRRYLDQIGRATMSLDGAHVLIARGGRVR